MELKELIEESKEEFRLKIRRVVAQIELAELNIIYKKKTLNKLECDLKAFEKETAND